MPFTPSHAVVALPFVRTPLIPAAIAIGAMTPDLPLYLRGTPVTYQLTHTNLVVAGLVALGLLVVWWAVLRPAVRELSPRWLAVRLPATWDAVALDVVGTVRRPRTGAGHPVWREALSLGALIAVSLLLGVASHVVWDAFTHEGRWGVEVFPALAEQWGPFAGYKWLQHASTVLGLAVVFCWMAVWLRHRRPAASVPRLLPGAVRGAWWLSLPVILIVAWCGGLVVHGPLDAEFTAAHLGYLVLPPACAVWGAITFALCIVVLTVRVRSRPQ